MWDVFVCVLLKHAVRRLRRAALSRLARVSFWVYFGDAEQFHVVYGMFSLARGRRGEGSVGKRDRAFRVIVTCPT